MYRPDAEFPVPAPIHPGASLDLVDRVAIPLLRGLGLAAQIDLTGGATALRTPLWSEELVSELLVVGRLLPHMARAPRAGADPTPPSCFLRTRVISTPALKIVADWYPVQYAKAEFDA